MRRRTRALCGDERGAAFVEFALLAPFMLVMLFGAVELVQAIEAHRRLQHVAYAVADIVAQQPQNTALKLSQLDDLVGGGKLMMDPFPPAGLVQRVASVSADAKGALTTDWVYPVGTTDMTKDLPAGFLKPNRSVIVTDVTYQYAAATHLLITPSFTMRQHAYLRPRFDDKVAFDPKS